MNASLKRLMLIVGPMAYVGLCSVGMLGCPGKGAVSISVCLQCHDGSVGTDQSEFLASAHDFIECEGCHESGYLHVRNGGRGGLYIFNPEKQPFAEHFNLCTDCHGQQVDGYLESEHAEERAVTCYQCHDPHVPTGLVRPAVDNSLCMECHSFSFPTAEAVVAHTHHPVEPAETGASRCTSCHMPSLVRVDQENGPHDHTLQTIPPIVSALAAESGAPVVPPNSCAGTNGCHDGSTPGEPVFNVDDPGQMRLLQSVYDLWFPGAVEE